MDRRTRTPYPAAAPRWMVGEQRARVLDVAAGGGAFTQMLVASGHEVFGIDRDAAQVAALGNRLGTQVHVAARVEALPFLACHFDVVTAAQSLHHFAPGLALSEIARVLKPRGQLAVVYNTRDETVPWVNRLINLMRQVDPGAVTGDYGVEAVDAVFESPYFGDLESRSFRHWVPISRQGLVAMVERKPATQQLDSEHRASLLREVEALYDSSARAPEPLLLPFRATCWRAAVDHAQLSAADGDFDAVDVRL